MKCMPVCKACRESGICSAPISRDETDSIMQTLPRDRYPNDLIRLPCGCMGMPWPLIHTLGQNFDEIYCDNGHGWQKITSGYMKKAKESARKYKDADTKKRNRQLELEEEPPY